MKKNFYDEDDYYENLKKAHAERDFLLQEVGNAQPSFFDSPEEAAKKEKLLRSFPPDLIEAYHRYYSDHEAECKQSLPLDEEVPEQYIPSIWDSADQYERKYNLIQQNYPAFISQFIPPDQVQLICPHPETHHTQLLPNIPVSKNRLTPFSHTLCANNFVYSRDELLYVDEENNTITIANFCIEILCEELYISDNNSKSAPITKWEILFHCGNEHFHQRGVSRKELYNPDCIYKFTHDRGYIETSAEAKQFFRKYINFVFQEKQHSIKTYYCRSGWQQIPHSSWEYLTSDGAIGNPTLPFFADVSHKFVYDKQLLHSQSIFDACFQARNLCTGHSENSVFLLHYVCLSTLSTLFQEAGHGLNFAVALIGETNSQKTSLAVALCKLFDRTTKLAPDIQFTSTEIAITECLESYGDAIVIIDDLVPQNNSRSSYEQQKKSERVIRSVGDRVPRKRSQVYAQINNVPSSTEVLVSVIMTGELISFNSESSATRTLQLFFHPGDVNLDLLTFFQQNPLIVPTFVAGFISYIREIAKDLISNVDSEIRLIREKVQDYISTPRFRDVLGMFSIETQLFYDYLVTHGFLSSELATNYQRDDMAYITQIVMENQNSLLTQKPAAVILAALKRTIINGFLPIISKASISNKSNFLHTIFEDDQFYIIATDVLLDLYTKYCRETHRDVLYKSTSELATPLKQANVLFCKKEGKSMRSTHKICAHTNSRFFFIIKERFYQICNELEKV